MSSRFGVGDRVRCRCLDPTHHNRAPGYVQDHAGEVVAERGAAPRPTISAPTSSPEPVYGVRFEADNLWPDAGDHAVTVDLWESYLEPAALEPPT